jgi:hypothetical protein
MPYVYRHIRLDKNEPFYIGISKKDSPNYERAFNCDYRHRNQYWVNIFNQSEIEVEILFEDVSYEFAKQKEIEFIKLYGRFIDGGTLANLTEGGDGVLGFKNPKLTERNKLGIWKGRKHTEETKKIMSIRSKSRKHNSEQRKKMSESKIGMYSGSKNPRYLGNVYCFDLNNNLLSISETMKEAAIMHKVSISTVTRRINGIIKQDKFKHILFFSRDKDFKITNDEA